jgi:hypothetical protein
MGTRLQKEHWPIVLRQMFTVLKKGACIELVENELFNYQLGPVSTELLEHYKDQCKQQNLALDSQQIPILLNQIGFEGIECKVIDVPLGEWPDETGNRVLMLHGSYSLSVRIKTFWIHEFRYTKSTI